MERVRGVAWSIVINNPTIEEQESLKEPLPSFVKQVCWQLETAPSTGTIHLQGALYTTRIDWTVLKKKWPRANLQVARNPDALRNYCKKSETSIPDSFYEYPLYQGRIEEPEPEPEEDNSPTDILMMMARNCPFEQLDSDDYKRFRVISTELVRDNPRQLRNFNNQGLFWFFKLMFKICLECVQEEEGPPAEPDTDGRTDECLIEDQPPVKDLWALKNIWKHNRSVWRDQTQEVNEIYEPNTHINISRQFLSNDIV